MPQTIRDRLTIAERARVIAWLRELRHPWTAARLRAIALRWESDELRRLARDAHRPQCPVQK